MRREITFTAHRHIFDRGPRGRYHSTPHGRGVLVRVILYEEGFFASWGEASDRTDSESISVVRLNGELALFGVGEVGERRVYLLCPPTIRLRGGGPVHRWEKSGGWQRDILHGERLVSTEVLGFHCPPGTHPRGRGGKTLSYDDGGENPVTLTLPTLRGGKNVPPGADQVSLFWEIG